MFSAASLLKSNKQSFQTGQGILEVIVTVGIGTIMLLALVILSVQANRASDFSKTSSQAASLASEGIEIVHNIKSRSLADPALALINYSNNCNVSATPSTWLEIYQIEIESSTSSACQDTNYGVIASIESGTLDIQVPGLTLINQPAELFAGRTFYRAVYIADSSTTSNCNLGGTDATAIKQFTVVVTWTDSSGTHRSTQSNCIGINENSND